MTFYTKNCINHPERKAIIFTGHVHKGLLGKTIVVSGWCGLCTRENKHTTIVEKGVVRESVYKKRDPLHVGCDGKWKRKYGIQSTKSLWGSV